MSECVWFNAPLYTITCNSGDESFQAIDYTGTDNQTTTKRKQTKHKT